ncbi:ethanolamine utilization phosphate acetyltransferase EutD [Microbacteriaceae bacterium 4G12]
MDTSLTDNIAKEVLAKLLQGTFIEVEASGRHVHLSRKEIEALFGEGYQLTKLRNLSQPGQFLSKEKVTLIGPKGVLQGVAILGPERSETQVEISQTDALLLGIHAPIRESGHLDGTPPIILATNNCAVRIEKGAIVVKRHIHVSLQDAEKFQVQDKEIAQVKVFGKRPLIFDDVVIRVSPNYQTYMHIDYDEANACGFTKGTLATIVKKGT